MFTEASRCEQADARILHRQPVALAAKPPSSEVEQGGDDDVHRRARQRHDQLLRRLLRDALQPRHAADRQEGDVGRLHAVAPGGEDVAELVQQHAQEQQAR